jgi:MFS family permease
MTVTTETIPTSSQSAPKREHGALYRFLFVHEVDQYPTSGRRSAYLSLAVLATIILYYLYYTQTGVTPNILRYFHMSFTYYVWIVIISNALGAFASLLAAKTDTLGRANVIIYGLLIVGLLILFGVPNVTTELGFAIVISAVGLVEGAILVATPAMVRDFSPQLGRASAMGFWTVGPVAGSLITSIVATQTLSHFMDWGSQDWHSQFIISGLAAIATFIIALFFMRDLSAKVRDQLMVSVRDRTLVEARARGLSETEVVAATEHPWRQIAKWDLAGSSFGIATFLLVYYVAAGFFTIYFTVNFVNANGVSLSTSQVNGLNAWFWGADIVSLIVVGWVSDRLRVRKPLMLVGAIGAIVTLIVFLGYATHPHTSYFTLAFTACILAFFLSTAYAPWMAGYTESVEKKNPALVATGLALWGWILRLVVAISFIFLPVVINSVNPVVDNQPIAAHVIDGQSVQNFVVEHADSVAFATAHASLLKVISANQSVVNAVAANPSAANVAAATKALGPADFAQLVKYSSQLKTLVQPYQAQLTYLSAHQSQLIALQNAVKKSPQQWQHWFWVDVAGMVIFIPTIWLIGGPWSPGKAKRDAEEHDRAVEDELARILKDDPSPSPA